jgi:prepilin-type N-terminal cleavage/methylation domain-containing protein
MIRSSSVIKRRTSRGLTLVEVMLAVMVLGIMAALAVPSFEPSVLSQLRAVAQIVAADVGLARDLAISNNSKYRLTFERTENRYRLEHSGTNGALDTLPATPFTDRANTALRQYTDMDELPHLGVGIRLAEVELQSSPAVATTSVEFGSLGSTTASSATAIWLTAGTSTSQHYVAVTIDAVTGLAEIGDPTTAAPATASGS